jgi:hypothetical protein
VILSALTFVGVTNAQSFKTGNTITVAANEVVDGMLFAGGNAVDIAGTVNGDVYCAGQSISISGVIQGDVFCAGQTITISGQVDGSVRLAGQNVTLSGTIGNSATIASQNLSIESKSTINRDLLGASQNITINGTIQRDILIGSENLAINGDIKRNVGGEIKTITVGSTGNVGGNVEYTGTSDPIINDGGKIVGTVKRTEPTKEEQAAGETSASSIISSFAFSLLTMLAIGFILVALFRHILDDASSSTIQKPGKAALVGFLTSISLPILIIILFISMIGVPIAIITILIWIAILMICGPFVGYMLGQVILKNTKYNQPAWAILLGILVLNVLYIIPILGFITLLAVGVFGTGMILIQGKRILRPGYKK